MNQFSIKVSGRDTSIKEAVEIVTQAYNGGGVIERLQETINNQNAMLARILEVMVNDYTDQYNDPAHAPKDFAEQLSYILSGGLPVVWVKLEKSKVL